MAVKEKMSFKEAYNKLEEISAELADSDLDIEEGMKLVKEAESLHKLLKKKLQAAKLVVKKK
ncbi:exodeoxyribonuclease VII small subunit [Patescibacteria group bacterium]